MQNISYVVSVQPFLCKLYTVVPKNWCGAVSSYNVSNSSRRNDKIIVSLCFLRHSIIIQAGLRLTVVLLPRPCFWLVWEGTPGRDQLLEQQSNKGDSWLPVWLGDIHSLGSGQDTEAEERGTSCCLPDLRPPSSTLRALKTWSAFGLNDTFWFPGSPTCRWHIVGLLDQHNHGRSSHNKP